MAARAINKNTTLMELDVIFLDKGGTKAEKKFPLIEASFTIEKKRAVIPEIEFHRMRVQPLFTALFTLFLCLFMTTNNAKHSNPFRFELMSYNIQSGSGYDHVYNLTRQANAINQLGNGLAMVSLQEVDNMTKRHAGDDQLLILSNKTSMPYYRFAKFRPFQGGSYGIAIMSRLEIIDTRVLHFEKPASSSSDKQKGSWDEKCAVYAPDDFCQGALALLIKVPETPAGARLLWYVTTHLGLKGIQAEEARQLAHNLIIPLQEMNIPIVLSGDFNSVPNSDSIKILLHDANLIDTWDRCGSKNETGFTFDSHNPTVRIDYQLMWLPNGSKYFDCTRATIPVTEASDHRPYVVEYEFS